MIDSIRKNWNDLDASYGGRLSRRAHEIRVAHMTITAAEAQVAVLVEMDLKTRQIAKVLDREEHTIELQRSSLRKKMKAPRNVSLALLFSHIPKNEGA